MRIEWDEGVTLKPFRPLYESEHDIHILWGGRDSGKTYNLPHKLVNKCIKATDFKCILFRSVYKDIKDSQYTRIKQTIIDFGLEDYFTFVKHPLEIHCKINGNSFIARSEDEPERLKSIEGATDLWAEEATQIKEATFDTLFPTLRSNVVQPQAWLTFNPEVDADGKNWIVERFLVDKVDDIYETQVITSTQRVNDQDVTLSVLSIHTTADDNKYVTPKRLAFLDSLRDYDPNKYKVWRLGQLGKKVTGMEYYHKFKYEKHVKDVPYLEGFPLHVTFDFNYLPYMTANVAQVREKDGIELRFIKSYTMRPPVNTIEDTCEAILDEWKHLFKYGLFIYGDTSGKNSQPVRKRRNYYEIIKENMDGYVNDLNIRLLRSNPAHEQRINKINRIFYDHSKLKIVFDEKQCKDLILDLENVKMDANGKKLKEKEKGKSWEKYGHHSDSFDYLLFWFLKFQWSWI